MEYRNLAQQLLELRQDSSRMEAERNISKALDGRLFVLQDLFDCNGSAYPKELCNDMGVSTARIASIVNQLEDKGWVERKEDPSDSRHTIVMLTQLGVEKACQHKEEVIDKFTKILESLGPDDAREYVRLQAKVSSSLAHFYGGNQIGGTGK